MAQAQDRRSANTRYTDQALARGTRSDTVAARPSAGPRPGAHHQETL